MKKKKCCVAGFIFCLVRMRPGGTCKIKQNLSSVNLGEDDIQLNSTMGVNRKKGTKHYSKKKKKIKHQKRMREKRLKLFLVVY